VVVRPRKNSQLPGKGGGKLTGRKFSNGGELKRREIKKNEEEEKKEEIKEKLEVGGGKGNPVQGIAGTEALVRA